MSTCIPAHPLTDFAVRQAIERAASVHLGRPWSSKDFVDLDDLASHRSGIFQGESISVFATLATDPLGRERFVAELDGLALIHERAVVMTPTPLGSGIITVGGSVVLLMEALSERRPETRSMSDWRSIGSTLARIHQIQGEHFGLHFDGFYGPLRQQNGPVSGGTWTDFFVQRRLIHMVRSAVDSGNLPQELQRGVEAIISKVDSLSGPEPHPTLLHGDAQQQNFVSTNKGAAIIDPAPYFGHPEMDLAQIEVFNPVPGTVFDAYREIAPIDSGFDERRELWRLWCYLAVATVEQQSALFGRRMFRRLSDAVNRYR
jgi:fructosamine-3-kinase